MSRGRMDSTLFSSCEEAHAGSIAAHNAAAHPCERRRRLATLTPAPRVLSTCRLPLAVKRTSKTTPRRPLLTVRPRRDIAVDDSTPTSRVRKGACRYPTGSVIVPADRWMVARTSSERYIVTRANRRVYEVRVRNGDLSERPLID